MKINCIIIDPDPLAVRYFRTYCKLLDQISLQGTYSNALEAIEKINSGRIDLIIAAIDTPFINEREFSEALEYKPLFICTLPEQKFMSKGVAWHPLAYLKKPVEFPEFVKVVSKVLEVFNSEGTGSNLVSSDGKAVNFNQMLYVLQEESQIRINVNDIVYIHEFKGQRRIYLDYGKPVLTSMSFDEIENNLNDSKFIRVHDSFMINTCKVKKFRDTRVVVNGTWIPLGTTYRDMFLSRVGVF
ncbi:LytR/AlgR family response regulator transcription factor [Robertkochia solimangrovi]|uniref:LytR/AlgR family response regulator transcription factor n=1 Tax=Robertkochia solimangrovi TaxID=2213046 RepID=UPI0013A55A0E|nr:LytTR family transcriptional regulator DNA-binding domain-containing protein [Robertkochia solimangrovi]